MEHRRDQDPLWILPGLFALALAVRCLSWPIVFGERGVFPYGFDAYYHLRRILYTAAHFPSSLAFDPYINYPEGAQLHWTPLFDAALALLAKAFVDPTERGEVVRLLVWVPPILGALTVVGTHLLSRRFLGRRAALWAGLFLALVPAHANQSEIGFIDHHVAVALASLALLAASMEYLARASDPLAPSRPLWALAALLGGAIALAFHLQPGMLLEVGIVEVALLASFLALHDGAAARARAAQLAGCHLVAFALLAPFAGTEWPRWGAFHPAVLSGFQPWLVAFLFLAYALSGALASRLASRGGRLAAAALVGSALLLISFGWIPELRANLEETLRIFGRSGVRSHVSEAEPLFSASAGSWRAVATLSGAVVLLPLLLLAGLWSLRRSDRRASFLLVLWYTFGLFVATLVQRRYANTLSIPLAMLVGWAITAWWGQAQGQRGRLRAPLWVAGASVIGLSLVPVAGYYRPELENQLAALRGKALSTHPAELRKRILVRTARWLGEHSEPSPGYHDATGHPPYGVLTSWTHGNVVLYEAQRAVVACNFADDVGARGYALSSEYFRAPPERAREILDELRVRYVISHHSGDFGPDAMQARLHYLDGSRSDSSLASDGGVLKQIEQPTAALPDHRLVFESLSMPPARGRQSAPAFKIFEYVAGARIEGHAPPGSTVAAQLGLVTNRGRRLRWSTRATADALGRYELVVPHATEVGSSALRPLGGFRVGLPGGGGSWHDVFVGENAIRSGASIPGPDLRSRP